jgi:hypothetical protein
MIIFAYFPNEHAKPLGGISRFDQANWIFNHPTPWAMSGHRDVLDKAEGCH